MKEPLVSKLLTGALYLVFLAGVLLTVTLPLMLEWYTGYFYDAYYLLPGYRRFILTFLIVVAVLGLWVVLEMIGMMRTIPTDPFVRRNVLALRRVGIIGLVIAALFFFKCILYVTFMTLLCGVILVICGLFAFTLSNLFRQAVTFKEENDLTI